MNIFYAYPVGGGGGGVGAGVLLGIVNIAMTGSGIEHPLVGCCGGEGPYGVSPGTRCGFGEYKLCDNPEKYGSWDVFHPSESTYRTIAAGLLLGSYTQPSIASTTSSCPQLMELGSSAEYKPLYDL